MKSKVLETCRMRNIFWLFILFIPMPAGATTPPPKQLTADCEAPNYASDFLVCEDDGLRLLDDALARQIALLRESAGGSIDSEEDQDWFRRSRLCAFETDHRECLVAAYCLKLALIDRSDTINHVECSEPLPGYIAASSISRSGFVSNEDRLAGLLGHDVGLFGFVDHLNLYGDEGARHILGDWWAGYGPDPTIWQFGLKANEDDGVGRSFTVQVPNDMLRDDLLSLFVQDAKEGRPTPVHVKGVLTTFPAPANVKAFLGLGMELESSWKIRLGPRPAP